MTLSLQIERAIDQVLAEAFQSSIARKIARTKVASGTFGQSSRETSRNVFQVLANFTEMPKIKWNKIQDSDFDKMSNRAQVVDAIAKAEKTHRPYILFWMCEKPRQVVDPDKGTIPANTLLGVTAHPREYRGWEVGGKLGLYTYYAHESFPVEMLAKYADMIYGLDIDMIEKKYSSIGKVIQRRANREGAAALIPPYKFAQANKEKFERIISSRHSDQRLREIAGRILHSVNMRYREIFDVYSGQIRLDTLAGSVDEENQDLKHIIDKTLEVFTRAINRREYVRRGETTDWSAGMTAEETTASFVAQLRMIDRMLRKRKGWSDILVALHELERFE